MVLTSNEQLKRTRTLDHLVEDLKTIDYFFVEHGYSTERVVNFDELRKNFENGYALLDDPNCPIIVTLSYDGLPIYHNKDRMKTFCVLADTWRDLGSSVPDPYDRTPHPFRIKITLSDLNSHDSKYKSGPEVRAKYFTPPDVAREGVKPLQEMLEYMTRFV
jgi:hypothetical protein